MFQSSSNWDDFVPNVCDARGDFHSEVDHLPHDSAHLLNRFLRYGAPGECKGNPCTFAQKADALTRGPSQSARKHIPFLRQEFVDIIQKDRWTFLPSRLVLNEL
jgi:hypothetical protein